MFSDILNKDVARDLPSVSCISGRVSGLLICYLSDCEIVNAGYDPVYLFPVWVHMLKPSQVSGHGGNKSLSLDKKLKVAFVLPHSQSRVKS